MKILKILILLFIIPIVLLNGCGKQQTTKESICNPPYIEFMKGQCCLDSNNNQICDTDETVEEEQETEEIEEEQTKEYSVDFEIFGLFVDYLHEHKRKNEFSLHDISYKVVNKGNELDDLKLKVEIFQEDRKLLDSNIINLFKREYEGQVIKEGETFLGRVYLGLDSFIQTIGEKDVPIHVNITLYQGEVLLFEEVWDYIIKFMGEKIILVTFSDFSFNYNKIPVRFPGDSKIEFMIMRSDEDYTDFRITNLKSEPVEREFLLDYYCENKEKGSFLINHYFLYLDDLYESEVKEERYEGFPKIINPEEKINRRIPKLSCDTHVWILRKENDHYVRGY